MQHLHNIEKSAFRRGEYVGYGRANNAARTGQECVWRIRRSESYGWVASNGAGYRISARTLAALSPLLEG